MLRQRASVGECAALCLPLENLTCLTGGPRARNRVRYATYRSRAAAFAHCCVPKDFFSVFSSPVFLMYMRGVLAGFFPAAKSLLPITEPARTAASRFAFTPPKALRVWRELFDFNSEKISMPKENNCRCVVCEIERSLLNSLSTQIARTQFQALARNYPILNHFDSPADGINAAQPLPEPFSRNNRGFRMHKLSPQRNCFASLLIPRQLGFENPAHRCLR
jgi:hypothetical protein